MYGGVGRGNSISRSRGRRRRVGGGGGLYLIHVQVLKLSARLLPDFMKASKVGSLHHHPLLAFRVLL